MTTESEAPSPSDDPTAPADVDAEKAAARDRIARISAAPVAPWTVVRPLKPWQLFGRGTIPLAYRKVRDAVEIVGAVCIGLRGAPVLQLPEDCRPPGVTMRSVAVAGCDGIATATITPAGAVYVQTDRWSGGQSYYDLGLICFQVSEQLAQAVEAEAAKGRTRPPRTENIRGAAVLVEE